MTSAEIVALVEASDFADQLDYASIRLAATRKENTLCDRDLLRNSSDPTSGSQTRRWYIEKAKELFHADGTCEIDNTALVNQLEAPGAYVQAWVWVDDPAAAPPA